MSLRDYQGDAVGAVLKEWETVDSTMVVAATAAGKTRIMSDIIQKIQPARSMFICHRDLLIFQARDTIQNTTGIKCGIEMADLKVEYGIFRNDPVVISTVQTQISGGEGNERMRRFRPGDFGYLFVDESHHAVSPTFQKVINYYRQNPRLKVLGVTATPERADGVAMANIFQTVAYKFGISEGIAGGWLVPIDQFMVPVDGLDYSHISTQAGDLSLSELSAVMEEEETVQRMIQPTLEICHTLKPHQLDYSDVTDWGSVIARNGKPKRTLIFCASVAQAQRFAEIMNRVRPGMAAAVWDKIPKPERRKLFENFSNGSLQVLVNVGICSEGFDNPGVEIVVLARATKSLSLYTQWLGRCLRALKGVVDGPETPELRKAAIAGSGKPVATIVDFSGNSGRHKLITCLDVLGGSVSPKALEYAKKRAVAKAAPVRVEELLQESEEAIKARIERAKKVSESRRAKLVARSHFDHVKVDPFDALDITPTKAHAKSPGKKLSPGQASLLRRFGINPDDYEYAQAKQIFVETITRLKNKLATPSQCAKLKEFGYDTTKMMQSEAKTMIEKLRDNGWKRPATKVEL